jgi:hypothetical protein
MRRKADIERAAESGLPVEFSDVARVSRTQRVVTLRHVWPEHGDDRIWSGVRCAFGRGAQKIADRTGKSVEVYSVHGDLISCIEPDRFAREAQS